MKKYYCVDCKKELNKDAHLHGTKRCHSCAAKERYKNKKHPFIKLIGKHPWNYKGIEKLCNCQDCGKKIAKVTYYRGKRCKSCESKRRIILGVTGYKGQNVGDKNPNWQGGISFEPYSVEWTQELKESIRKRDDYKCQNCGLTNEEHLIVYDRELAIHHIDYNKKNCARNNLITLCNQCNSRANFSRNFWKEFYTNKLHEKLERFV